MILFVLALLRPAAADPPPGVHAGVSVQKGEAPLPADLATVNSEAYEALLLGNLIDAMRRVDRARELAPDDPETVLNRAILMLSIGQNDKAKAMFATVLAKRSDWGRAWLWEGVRRLEAGDAVGATEAVQTALTLELRPDERKIAAGLLTQASGGGATKHGISESPR